MGRIVAGLFRLGVLCLDAHATFGICADLAHHLNATRKGGVQRLVALPAPRASLRVRTAPSEAMGTTLLQGCIFDRCAFRPLPLLPAIPSI
jgi:hypothetical protein